MLKDKNSIIPNFGHDATPPDFYCNKHNMMFDILWINDTEVKKGYNPVMIEERKMEKEIQNTVPNFDMNKFHLITTGSSNYIIEHHTYNNYKKQGERVINHHIETEKIERYWETNFPNIKNKGLLIYDETELYFEGIAIPEPENRAIRCRQKDNLVLHNPWEDKNFMDTIYKSKIDFVIWANPYKPYGLICRKNNIYYPTVTIIDTRFPNDKYQQYDYENLVTV